MAIASSFAGTIKPYFTACYRAHMLTNATFPVDLWDPTEVQRPQVWQQIFNAVSNGSMPAQGCQEGQWDATTSAQFLTDFRAWQAAGFPS
jgi:hypothetical protein